MRRALELLAARTISDPLPMVGARTTPTTSGRVVIARQTARRLEAAGLVEIVRNRREALDALVLTDAGRREAASS
jgi:hypothetical protein